MLLEEELFVTSMSLDLRMISVCYPGQVCLYTDPFRIPLPVPSLDFCNARFKLLVITVYSLLITVNQTFTNANIIVLRTLCAWVTQLERKCRVEMFLQSLKIPWALLFIRFFNQLINIIQGFRTFVSRFYIKLRKCKYYRKRMREIM